MITQIKNHGLIIDEIKIEDYVLGGATTKLPTDILQENGSWLAYLPMAERQDLSIETYSCVSFGTLNIMEMLIKRIFGKEENFSDRYLAISSNTSPLGNSPQTVGECLRKVSGAIKEELLPFSDNIRTFEQYHSPKPLPEALINEGKKWLEKYEIKHEWVFQSGENKQEKLMEALKLSPVGVSVYAWQQDGDDYVKPAGSQDNHWTTCVGYEEGKHWIIFDSYPASEGSFLKKLVWNYDFQMAKRYYIVKKNEEVASIWQRIIDAIKNYISVMFK